MRIHKEISEDNELYLYMNGKLIYKKWLNTGQSKVFDVMAYDKYTYASYTDLDIQQSKHLIHLKAQIRLLTPDEGGRLSGIRSGYRPNHVFEYDDKGQLIDTMMGDIQFDTPEVLELGTSYEVLIRFIAHQRIEAFLEVGRIWWLHEASRKIGEAKIIEFINPPYSGH